MTADNISFKTFRFFGMALDPIHAGTGGTRLGRVDSTIIRDPVTRIPKIPGSSLAGVMRAYVAMRKENEAPDRKINGKPKPYYPDCAGQGGGDSGHCGQANCPVCTVFGFARGMDSDSGFAGLAGFSDMHVLLFPVATNKGPYWITSPMAIRSAGYEVVLPEEDAVFSQKKEEMPFNLGWLNLPVKEWQKQEWGKLVKEFNNLDHLNYIKNKVCLVSDKLFAHIVNSNLEVRTSVAIDPATGAAEDKALFTYEALPRGTVLVWELTCRNPRHFKINKNNITVVKSPEEVKNVISYAYPYLEHLGIGGMGSRGMGRLRVLEMKEPAKVDKSGKEDS